MPLPKPPGIESDAFKSTNRIGTVVEFDDRKTDAIHLVELTDTEADDRMVWADADDLEELPPDVFPAIDVP